MTLPRPRLDEAEDDFERELLRSWEHEGPSKQTRERAIGAIGAGGALLATTTTAGATGAGLAIKIGVTAALALALAGGIVVAKSSHDDPPPAASPAPRPADSVAGPAASLPRGASNAVAGPADAGSAAPTSTAADDKAAAASVPPARAAKAESGSRGSRSAPARGASAESVSVAEVPADTGSVVPMPVPAPPPTTEPKTRALGEQIALVDTARSALARGDAASALSTLDTYDSRFPTGSLAQEAILLRVEALLLAGRRGDANVIGNRAIAAQSPYAAKIRHLLDGESIP